MQSVFTDCPHREKLGWLEQVHLNGPGLLYNYDLTAYAPQIMQNMADAQHSNGAMPTTAPEYVILKVRVWMLCRISGVGWFFGYFPFYVL